MSEFVASNGRKVTYAADGSLTVEKSFTYLSPEAVQAIREFVQHERDNELGRWRWPENKNVTVRVAPSHTQSHGKRTTYAIEDEVLGYVGYYRRDDIPATTANSGNIVRAGNAYFAEHPEKQPWHEAKPNELWILTTKTKTYSEVYRLAETGRFHPVNNPVRISYLRTDTDIIDGHRIYPEEKKA